MCSSQADTILRIRYVLQSCTYYCTMVPGLLHITMYVETLPDYRNKRGFGDELEAFQSRYF